MQQKIFRRAKHHFFDDLVTFFSSIFGIAIALDLLRDGTVAMPQDGDKFGLEGSPVSNVKICFFPKQIVQPLVNNRWPDALRLELETLQPSPPLRYQHTGLQGILGSHIQSTFVRYFESWRESIEQKYTRNCQSWPAVWNFGRIIRNAFAHGGEIHFDNPNAQAVAWRTLYYSPADNGRQILFVDMTPVEVILLMEEMDSEL